MVLIVKTTDDRSKETRWYSNICTLVPYQALEAEECTSDRKIYYSRGL